MAEVVVTTGATRCASKAPAKLSPATNQRPVFHRPDVLCHPTNSVTALKEQILQLSVNYLLAIAMLVISIYYQAKVMKHLPATVESTVRHWWGDVTWMFSGGEISGVRKQFVSGTIRLNLRTVHVQVWWRGKCPNGGRRHSIGVLVSWRRLKQVVEEHVHCTAITVGRCQHRRSATLSDIIRGRQRTGRVRVDRRWSYFVKLTDRFVYRWITGSGRRLVDGILIRRHNRALYGRAGCK